MSTKNEQSNIESLISRPPVVVVMGHIDHGKSQLLDYIRKTKIVGGEKGGITQHIGAYEVEVKCNDRPQGTNKITFLDTPGHAAFSQIRSRGAKVADVAILIIAADDGVKPQTMEAYETLKEENVPFIIAINKIDKPEANPDQIKQQLAEKEIFVEGYGGQTPFVNISAKTGEGVQDLLDLILLQAEMEEAKADPTKNAEGFVVEAQVDQKRGISATLIIQDGTLRKKMFVKVGEAITPVRIMENPNGKDLNEATFSSPIKVPGFDTLPPVGERFYSFNSKKEAEKFDTKIKTVKRELVKIEEIEGKIIVPVVITADVSGSVEAMEKEIEKLNTDKAIVKVISRGVGKIKEKDLTMASSKQGLFVVGFNTEIDPSIKQIAEKLNIKLFSSSIIYEITDWLEKEINQRRKDLLTDEVIGKATIIRTFNRTKNKQVIGGQVNEGKILANGTSVKIKRKNFEIGKGKITELQHNKEIVEQVDEGKQFGMQLETKIEVAEGDTIEIMGKIE